MTPKRISEIKRHADKVTAELLVHVNKHQLAYACEPTNIVVTCSDLWQLLQDNATLLDAVKGKGAT